MRQDVDGTPQAWCIQKKLRRDYLAYQGKGVLCIYINRDTKQAFKFAVSWWHKRLRKSGVMESRDGPQGDYDGLVYFSYAGPDAIPREFKRSNRGGQLENLRKSPERTQGLAQTGPGRD